MKLIRVLIALAVVLATPNGFAQSEPIERAEALELQGKFADAAMVLTNALKVSSLSAAQRKQLEFEMDRLTRIRKDYPFTEDALFERLKASVKDLTRAEFAQWVAEGRFDSREIDGERRFMLSSVSNLYFRHPELESRRLKPKDSAAFEQARLANVRSIKQAVLEEKQPYVLPKRFRNTMIVTVNADAAPPGENIRGWLPIPRRYPFQKDFELRSSSPAAKEINSRDSSSRAVYLEAEARQAKPTKFQIEYEYTAFGVYFDIDPKTVKPVDPNDPALALFLREAPHVQFTPGMRALSREILGDETNPLRQAKKFHDWIAANIKYSYATEYSTIRNLSEYCRTKGYGDCGQEALLFITLCRLNGIPARWQSGWNTVPGGKTIHDWCEIYLSPHGWVPVDSYMGIWAMRYARTLTPEQQREVRDFYFGGLDQWRMAANNDHNQELSPPKKTLRSDTVDFQRGELEWGEHNLYFDQYDYALDVKEVKLPRVE